MANIKCNGTVSTQNLKLGKTDGTVTTPSIDFHTGGQTDINSKIIATGNDLEIIANCLKLSNKLVLTGDITSSETGKDPLNGLIVKLLKFTKGYNGNFELVFPVAFPEECLFVSLTQLKQYNTDFDKTTIVSYDNTKVSCYSNSYPMNYFVLAIGR